MYWGILKISVSLLVGAWVGARRKAKLSESKLKKSLAVFLLSNELNTKGYYCRKQMFL